ncbi:unnamed protein product [Lupinus luteus]|uniref:GIL1/IRKI C-terminal domain-containing protein n=1 Tax=Lupinus luteus TaxID=3873 RepID=A0AAV1XNU4_LUPLU
MEQFVNFIIRPPRCLILSTLQISLFLVSLFLTKGQVLETYSSEDGVIFFGDLNQRNILNTGEFPDTKFFTSFSEMAKRVWLLHCLAFSFEPQAFIFQVEKACRFSDVYMECMNDEISVEESERQVAFTVVPGFRIGRTIIQCQVYLSAPNQGKKFTAKTKVATRRHYS